MECRQSGQGHPDIEPVKWELYATPGLQGRPQAMINAELVPISDLLVAVFRSRAGSPTGKGMFGTIEEIREFMRLDKHVLLVISQRGRRSDW